MIPSNQTLSQCLCCYCAACELWKCLVNKVS